MSAAVPCPVEGCPTPLQPRPDGDLCEGVAAHLGTVHNLHPAQARKTAEVHLGLRGAGP